MAISIRTRSDGTVEPFRERDARKTFEHVVEAWEADRARQGKSERNTKHLSRKFMHMARACKVSRLDDLTPEKFAVWLEQLRTEGMNPDDPKSRPNTPKTVNDTICSVRAFYAWAVRREYCSTNPIRGFDMASVIVDDQRRFMPDEVASLIATARSDELSAEPERRHRNGSPVLRSSLYWVLATCGLRIGTAEQLAWEHVEAWEQPYRLNIPAAILKSRRSLTVALSEIDAAILREHHAMLLGLHGEPGPLVWGRVHKAVLLNDAMRAGVRLKDDDGHGASWHCFRRFVGSELANLGLHPKIAQLRLGHSDPRTTLRHYTQIDQDSQVSAARALGEKLGNSGDLGLTQGTQGADTGSSPMLMNRSNQTTEAPVPGMGDNLSGPGASSISAPGGGAVGSAPALGAGGRQFETGSPDSIYPCADQKSLVRIQRLPEIASQSPIQADERHPPAPSVLDGAVSHDINTRAVNHGAETPRGPVSDPSRDRAGAGIPPSASAWQGGPGAPGGVDFRGFDSPYSETTFRQAGANPAPAFTPPADTQSLEALSGSPCCEAFQDTQAGLSSRSSNRQSLPRVAPGHNAGSLVAGSTPAGTFDHPPRHAGTDGSARERTPADTRAGVPGRLDQSQLNRIALALAAIERGGP